MSAPLAPHDLDIAARTVWAEARSEAFEGQIAVAWVMRRRVEDAKRWPNTLAGVCLQRLQFSCWNDADPQRARLVAVSTADTEYLDALCAVAGVFADRFEDFAKGANHYLNPALASPSWAKPSAKVVTIGRHAFFRL